MAYYLAVGACALAAIALGDATNNVSYVGFSLAGLITLFVGVRYLRQAGKRRDESSVAGQLQAMAMVVAGPVFVVLGVLIAVGVMPAA
jgi:uncharacterized membrane protein